MATNTILNGYKYYRITRTIGHTIEDGKKKPIKKQFVGKSKAEAEAKYEKFLKQQNMSIDPNRLLRDIAEEFNEILIRDSNYTIGTRDTYIASYKARFDDLKLGNIPIGQLSHKHIQDAYRRIDCSYDALKTLHKYLKLLFKYCEKLGYCDDFMKFVIKPTKDKVTISEEIEVYSDQEVQLIKDRMHSHPYYPAIMLGLYAGLRVSEVLGLKWSDIKDGNIHIVRQCYRGKIIPPKAKGRRVIPMHPCIKDALADYPHTSDYIFVTDTGNHIDYSNFTRGLRRAYKQHDIPLHNFHCYRHTFATNLCKKGVPIQVASTLLGHSDITVTAKYYTRIDADQILQAVSQL